ncbi:MAG TPA: hypothetical protein VIH28_10170 [Ignavibacteriaceae bacterium]
MNKIREDLGNGIVRINLDELRYYQINEKFYPSVTWILDVGFPKGYGFKKWLAALPDWETGQQILYKAGDRGSKVHWGIQQLLSGLPISINDIPYGYSDSFTHEEWTYLLSFMNWYEDWKPLIFSIEETVWSDEFGYAGTADLICKIDINKDGKPLRFLLDWKTSGAIYDNHKLQVAAYAEARDIENIGIIRLGTKHKKGYEFWHCEDDIEINNYFHTFYAAYTIFKYQNPDPHPRFVDVPDKLVLSELQLEVTKDAQEHQNKDKLRLTGQD